MWEFLKNVVLALKPSDDPDPKVQLAWRWAVAILLGGGLLAGGAGIALASGWVPGFSGVATKDDVQQTRSGVDQRFNTLSNRINKIDSTVNDINLRMLKTDIQKAITDSCTAQAVGNGAAFQLANDSLFGTPSSDGLLRQYERIAKSPYPLPPCSAVLITTQHVTK